MSLFFSRAGWLYRSIFPCVFTSIPECPDLKNAIDCACLRSFVYQWFHKLTPSCFADYFKPISFDHPYYTRQSNNDNLFLNQVQTTQYGLRSLCFFGAKLWNSLPLDIKQITPFSRFRQNVKNSMIDSVTRILIIN